MSEFSRCGCRIVSLDELENKGEGDGLQSGCPFVLPFWLRLWQQCFGGGYRPLVIRVVHEGESIGLAPLQVRDARATFMGSEEVLDYQDMSVRPGREGIFFPQLLTFLADQGVGRLELGALHPESAVMRFLPDCLRAEGYAFRCRDAGRLYSLESPSTWEEYLARLDGKQRHEIRRKFRRLREAGTVRYEESVDGSLEDWLEVFFTLFRSSSAAKAAFLSDAMRRYFRGLAEELHGRGMLRPGTLSLAGEPIAATFGFVCDNTFFLYNNGYLRRYAELSPGQLCKLMSLRLSILEKTHRYNFLKGDEDYKRRMGGRATALHRLEVDLTSRQGA